MLDNLINFFKKMNKKEDEAELLPSSSDAAKERLHLVLMQDRANVSVDFMDMMKQEILDVIKKYIDIDEKEMDVRLTNQVNEDGSNGAPALYANIPIVALKSEKNKSINSNNLTHQEENEVSEVLKQENENKIKMESAKKRITTSSTKSSEKKADKNDNEEENKDKQTTRTRRSSEKKQSVSE